MRLGRWSACAAPQHQGFHDLSHNNSLVEDKIWMHPGHRRSDCCRELLNNDEREEKE